MTQAIQRALISVSDKTGVVEFAKALHNKGVALLSTGGTYRKLTEAGLDVKEVSEQTGFPEMMDGRVKTLHPVIHGGILGRRGTDDTVMQEHNIDPIDLIVVNLYPFAATIAKPDCTLAEAVENIDIGGPTMLRSAAKNHKFVGVVTDIADYSRVLADMEANNNALSDKLRFDLAVKTFEHTAKYDSTIANHFGRLLEDEAIEFPRTINLNFEKKQELRYGENSHQQAAFYVEDNIREACISTARQLQGKALSYNNIADTDAALECVKSFAKPACVIVKHANPCGVAVVESEAQLTDAYKLAFATDNESSFGGIIAFNRQLDTQTASAIIERQFVEVIIAPSVADGVAEIVAAKKNVRLLECGELPAPDNRDAHHDYKRVTGGLLVQDKDLGHTVEADLKVVTKRAPTKEEMADLLFTWKVAKYVKSNAIVYGKNQQTVGVGAGQMSRVNSARIATDKAHQAGLAVEGAVMASDAFFPFRDGIDNAAKAGIKAVIQPGGSIRDEEVIQAADEAGIAMVFTGMRHFRH